MESRKEQKQRTRHFRNQSAEKSDSLTPKKSGKEAKFRNALFLIVVNANRPETRDLEGALEHMVAIELKTGRRIDGVINNCHLLRETDAECVAKGHRLCEALCASAGRFLWCDCYPEGIVPEAQLAGQYEYLMPLGMYMRPSWIDR